MKLSRRWQITFPPEAGKASDTGPAVDDTRSRKGAHLRINLEEDVSSKGVDAGFDAYAFVHNALPEMDLEDVDTSATIFGRTLHAPILISCMTGGTMQARRFNRVLARAAQDQRLAMGLGSGRALLEHPEVIDTFDVRSLAPDVLLLANLGAVQLNKGYGVDDCRRLVSMLRADALVLHLNPVQEALQLEGDTNFRGLLQKIEDLCKHIDVPVVVKEVGWGISSELVRKLFDAGASAIDVAGAGGTSWSEVERHRIAEPWRARVAGAFAGWGIPTAQCLREARAAAPDGLLIASGGLRDGMDVAKAIALGANLTGMAGPFLRAAANGYEGAVERAREVVEVLRIAMFATGARTLDDFRGTARLRLKNGTSL